MASDRSPTMIRIQVTNRPKLSAATRSKLVALCPHRNAVAIAAPIRPTTPRPAIGMRSPGSRNASATIAAIAAAVTHVIGTMALRDCIMGRPDGGSGIGDWGLGIGPDSQLGIRDSGFGARRDS